MTAGDAFIRARDFLLKHPSDYDTACREFVWPELTHFNWALDYFDYIATGNGKPCLWITTGNGDDCVVSFERMSRRSNQTANWLRSLGVQHGDRILLMLGNELALWESMLAAMKLGAVVLPSSTLLTPEDLRDRFERGVKHVITNSEQVKKFSALAGDWTRICVGERTPGWRDFQELQGADTLYAPQGATLASDPFLLYFTSGTTSRPKLVLHTHQSYPVGHLSTMYWVGLRPGDIHLNISSPGWAKHAWSSFFAPWNAQACVFIYNSPRFNAKNLLDILSSYGVTSLCAPPTVWRMLIQEDLAAYRGKIRIRELAAAGEPLNPEIIERVQDAWNVTIRDGFGQSETTAIVGNSPGQALKPGSMGRPLPGYRVVIVDGSGAPADEGEIALDLREKNLGLMAGYADAGQNGNAMQGGLYRTGDIASIDDDGYITYVGRSDDVFKASDYRISPFELESAAIEHPAIAEAAVVPSPDPVRLAVPKVFISLRQGHAPSPELAAEIFLFFREKLAPYKRVRRLEFCDLPKTISGKIRRVELRTTEAQRMPGDKRREWEFFEEDFAVTKAEHTPAPRGPGSE